MSAATIATHSLPSTTFQSITQLKDKDNKSTTRINNVITPPLPIDTLPPAPTTNNNSKRKFDTITGYNAKENHIEKLLAEQRKVAEAEERIRIQQLCAASILERKVCQNKKTKIKARTRVLGQNKKIEAGFACPHCSKGFLTQSGLDFHVENKICQKRKKKKIEAENKREEKAKGLVASLNQSDQERVKMAIDESWDFEKGEVKKGEVQLFDSTIMSLYKQFSDMGDVSLAIRKVCKPEEKIHQFKNHDKYLFILDRKVREVVTRETREKCLKLCQDDTLMKCTDEDACSMLEGLYERLGFSNAKEMAAKGLRRSKEVKDLADY